MSESCGLILDICKFSLKTYGYVIGWVGVAYKATLTIALCVALTRLSEQDLNILTVLYSVALSYCLLSLIGNFVYIIGISKKKNSYQIAYILMGAFELLLAAIILIGGCIMLSDVEEYQYFNILLGAGLVIFVILVAAWICTFQLFNKMRKEHEVEKNARFISTRPNPNRHRLNEMIN